MQPGKNRARLALRVTSHGAAFSNLRGIFALFSRVEKAKLTALVSVQILLSLLDLLGVALIGIIGSLAVRGIQAKTPGDRVGTILEFLNIENETLQFQVTILGSMVALALVGRTLISVLLTKRSLLFLSRRSAKLSSDLLRSALELSLIDLRTKSSQDFLFSLTSGVNVIMLGIVASIVNAISDITMLLVLSVGLFFVDTTMAITSVSLFTLIALLLYRLLHTKALNLGEQDGREQILSNTKILEVFSAYREYSVKNRKYFAFKEIQDSRYRLALITAEKSFMPNISKYVFEAFLVLGSLVICAVQFSTQDASRAIGTLAIFLAAGTRIAPAIMRVQQSALTFKSCFGVAESTLEIFQRVGKATPLLEDERKLIRNHDDFEPNLNLSNVSFKYPGNDKFALRNISFKLQSGQSCGLIGDSGSGKSTLADLILGMLSVGSGSIQISGLSPREAINKWPGAIGYVPQEIFIARGSIKENVCLGFDANEIKDEIVWEALRMASLDSYVKNLPDGIQTRIGDGEKSLSGGQRQRIGIARALITNPKLIIFDEATSSLDNNTEREIALTINKLKKTRTLIVIAHRFTTIQRVDKLAVMKNGSLVEFGPRVSIVKKNKELARFFALSRGRS
jgi:ABC-type multidrug transport system fused ATPase/permease subunit